jgi:hypothetical protein
MFDTNRAPILRQDLHYLQTDRNVLSLMPRYLGVPSAASKEKEVILHTTHVT